MQQWAREVKKEKYGNEYFNNHEKAVKTNLKKYGVENPLQNGEILDKMKKTTTASAKGAPKETTVTTSEFRLFAFGSHVPHFK